MKQEKWFAFRWLDGKTTYNKGKDVGEAAHLGVGGIMALDYYEEVKEIPDDKKEIRCIFLDGRNEIMHPDTMFAKQASKQILDGSSDVIVSICNKTWNCNVEKKNYEFVLTEHLIK
ncbi:hypothetical protein K413DRAFT_3392 [Clostridium sp. ASBs410]|jgi:hypothetical protein|nr:hypothetical protein K413DRAFT_3392 [Clostridium sp. ASBs410]